MRYSSKKIVLAMLTVLFAVLLAAVPMTAFAADVAESISVVTIAAEGVSISPDEAKEDKTVIHAMTVELEGGSVSSFEMQIRMPLFVDVVEIKASERLAAVSENGVFEWYVDESSGYVNVAYSSPYEFSYIPLFDIAFTVNDYTEQYAAVECVSVRTVDADYNELPTHVAFGVIAIGEVSSTMMGDVDGNGLVNLADLLVIQRSIVNPNYPLNEVQFALADINRDGAVNIVDCQYIQNYLVGKLDSLENVGQQTVIYTYNMSMRSESEDGVASVTDISYSFYSNGIVCATMTLTVDGKLEREETQEAIWLRVGQYIDITFEGETERMFVVDEYGDLSLYQDGGSDVQPEETELSEYKNKYYNEVKMSWSELTQKCGDLSAYEDMLKEIFTGIENATSISEVDSWYNTFEQLKRKVVANEGGTTVEDYVISTEIKFGDFGITVGASKEDLLSKIVGQPLYVTYSQSGTVTVPITEDMIDYQSVMLDSIGSYELIISYATNNGGYYNNHLTVYVNPDMSEVPLLGTYKIDFDEEMPFTEFMLYEGGTAVMKGGNYDNVHTTYYMVSDGVAAVDMEGVYLVFSLGEGVATFFDPASKFEVIGTYVYNMQQVGKFTLVVYGEYKAAGDYLTVMRVQLKNPETGEMIDMTITTVAYLDQANKVIRHAVFRDKNYDDAGNIYCPHTEVRTEGWDGDCWSSGWRRTYCANCREELNYEVIPTTGHNFDETGYCDRCGMNQGGVDNDLNNYKNQMLKQMMNDWSEITNGRPVSEEFQWRFNELTAILKEAESHEAVDSLYNNNFRMLCEEARTSTNIYIQHYEMNPHSYHVTAGTSLEQFIAEFIKNVTITVYYSDGSCEVRSITEDMLKYSDLDLSAVGRTYVSVSYHDELTGRGISFEVSVYVDPDMTGAQITGTYTYVGDIMNAMEWDRAELYDNGIMILYEGDYSEFVEYTLSGDVLSYVTYDVTVLYRIVNDSEVTFYQSEQVIGKYTYTEEDGEGFTMTVFDECNEAGEYYAYVKMFEVCEDGSYEYYGATTVVIFDKEARKIYCELIGGWSTFDEAGIISPMECEHEFDENGKCTYCGCQQSTDSGSTGDAVVDTEKLPAVEVVPSTDGEYSYTEGVYSTVA